MCVGGGVLFNCVCGEGGYKESKSKKKKKKKIFLFNCVCVCVGGERGGGGGGGGLMDGQRNRPKPICPLNFFEIGDITIHKCTSYGPDKLNL